MSERKRIWSIDLRKIEGPNSLTPGVLEVAAQSKEDAIRLLMVHMNALLTTKGVIMDTTWEYDGAMAVGDWLEPDYGQYEPDSELVAMRKRMFDEAQKEAERLAFIPTGQEKEKATAVTVAGR